MKNNGLQEFLKNTPALCEVRDYDTFFTMQTTEPEWLKKERIKLSLEAMAEFILDDSIGTEWLDGWRRDSPLFMQLDPHPWMSYHPGWGRGIWIQDIGILEYKPAYDSLREVWLHDNKKGIRHAAFLALTKLKDGRTIEDIRKRIKQGDIVLNEYSVGIYLEGLENIGTDETVPVIMELAEILKSLSEGREVNSAPSRVDELYNLSPLSSNLRSVLISLHVIRTEKAKNAAMQIVKWFPIDGMIVGAYRDCTYFEEQRKEAKIVQPKREALAGSGRFYDFF